MTIHYVADYLERITNGGFTSGFIYTELSFDKVLLVNLEVMHLHKE